MFSLAIIIPNYNKGKYLETCLNSIISQNYKVNEIIVFDDCSTDNSREILNKYEQKYPFIKLIYSDENVGVSQARNSALEIVKSDYITMIDSDDYYYSENKLFAEMSKVWNEYVRSGVKVVSFSQTVLVDQHGDLLKRLIKKPLGVCVRFGTVTRMYKYQVPRDYCFPKELLKEVGDYDLNYNLYEDWDINLRFLSKTSFVFSKEYGTAYRISGNGLSAKDFRRHFKCKMEVFEKNKKQMNYSWFERTVFYTMMVIAYVKGYIKNVSCIMGSRR